MQFPAKAVPHPQSTAELNALLPDPGSDGWTFFEHFEAFPPQKTTDFRQVNAWWAIEMSYLSYATSSDFAVAQLAAAGFHGATFGFDRAEPPHILIAHNADIVFVAFRGTRVDQLADILADVAFLPSLTSHGFVHRGFQNALNAGGIWEAAQRHLASIAGNQVIIFTGHSLGAALATLARRTYRDPAGRAIAACTFGSPRVGDGLFYAADYPAPLYRLVNDRDIVTHVPTPPVYAHVGTAFDCTGALEPGDLWESLERQFAAVGAALAVTAGDERAGRLRAVLFSAVKPLADHAPKSYAAKIWNALA